MKKVIPLLIVLAITIGLVAGCSIANAQATDDSEVTATVAPSPAPTSTPSISIAEEQAKQTSVTCNPSGSFVWNTSNDTTISIDKFATEIIENSFDEYYEKGVSQNYYSPYTLEILCSGSVDKDLAGKHIGVILVSNTDNRTMVCSGTVKADNTFSLSTSQLFWCDTADFWFVNADIYDNTEDMQKGIDTFNTSVGNVIYGKDGQDGNNGLTPTIGNNGNWWIGGTDTGSPAKGSDGQDGASMSDSSSWLENYPIGTKFPVEPSGSFDWEANVYPSYGSTPNNNQIKATVHISALSFELIEKITYDEWRERVARGEIQAYFYTPFIVKMTVEGYTNPDFAGADLSLWGNVYSDTDTPVSAGIGGEGEHDLCVIAEDGSFSCTKSITGINNYGTIRVSDMDLNGVTIPSVESFVSVARAQKGKPYVNGGKGPDSFDDSGLVYYALNESGYNIGYMTSDGWVGSSYPTITNMEDLQRGDIICFTGLVAICSSDGTMIDASSSNGAVVERSYTGSWARNNFICGKRPLGGSVINSAPTPAPMPTQDPVLIAPPPLETSTTSPIPTESSANVEEIPDIPTETPTTESDDTVVDAPIEAEETTE